MAKKPGYDDELGALVPLSSGTSMGNPTPAMRRYHAAQSLPAPTPPPLIPIDDSDIYTTSGRARLDNAQAAQSRVNAAQAAPPPTSMPPMPPGEMSITLDKGQAPATVRPGDRVSTNSDGQTTVSRQGTMTPRDPAPQVQQMRNDLIQRNQRLATALTPLPVTQKEDAAQEATVQKEAGNLQNQFSSAQIERYHQMTPELVKRLQDAQDWSPEDRKQLLDTLRTYHEFNQSLLRDRDENRRQGQGDTRLGQGQDKVDLAKERFEQQKTNAIRAGDQGDIRIGQRDRALNQGDQRNTGRYSPTTRPTINTRSMTPLDTPAFGNPGISQSQAVPTGRFTSPMIPQDATQPVVGQQQQSEIKAGTVIEMPDGQRRKFNGIGWDNI